MSLGEGFWSALTTTVFQSKLSMYPLLRVALALANLVCPKVEDNIARTLTKGDISKLASKKEADLAQNCDQMLKEAFDLVQLVSDLDSALKPLGQMFVRTALYATDKGDKGPEGKKFTMNEIKQNFLGSLSKIAGKELKFAGWSDTAAAATVPAVAPGSKQVAAHPASLGDHSNPEWIAEQQGFGIGKQVTSKKSSAGGKLFVIFTIDKDAHVVLQQIGSYDKGGEKLEISLKELCEEWQTCAGQVPVCMKSGQQRPGSLQIDAHRCVVYKAILDVDSKTPALASTIDLWRKPDEARTGHKRIPTGSLVLVPVVPLLGISTKQVPKAVPVDKHNGIHYFLVEPSKPQFVPDDPKFVDQALIAAYWWVGPTGEQKEANMMHSVVKKGDIEVPVLKNHVDIEPYTRLLFYKKPAAAETTKALITVADPLKRKGQQATGSEKKKR